MIQMNPWKMVHGSKQDVSGFRAFGCMAYLYMNKLQQRMENIYHVQLMLLTLDLLLITIFCCRIKHDFDVFPISHGKDY